MILWVKQAAFGHFLLQINNKHQQLYPTYKDFWDKLTREVLIFLLSPYLSIMNKGSQEKKTVREVSRQACCINLCWWYQVESPKVSTKMSLTNLCNLWLLCMP